LVYFLLHYFSSLLFDFAKPQVGIIYQIKSENPLFLGLLLAFLVDLQEIFLRGYVQPLWRKYASGAFNF
jgi:hypothetical protein